jgi:hypothetical protein
MKLQKHKNQNIPQNKVAEKSKGMGNEKKRTRRKTVEPHLFVLTQNWAFCAFNCIGQAGMWGRRGRYRGILRSGMSRCFFPRSDVNHLLDGEFERKNVEEIFRRIHRKNPEVGLLQFLFGSSSGCQMPARIFRGSGVLGCTYESCSVGYLQNSEYCTWEVALFSSASFVLECAVFWEHALF